jgi:hypothetical protein
MDTATGDRILTASVASLLEQHGVSTRIERCGAARAQVRIEASSDQAAITIVIRDSEGKEARRRIERDGKVAAVAASLVESFVLGEDADLLSRPGSPAVEVAAGAQPASLERIGQIGLVGGVLFGSDSSTWYGAEIEGCARAAWSCLGVRARFAQDDSGGGISSDLVRTQWNGSALLGMPFNSERWQLLPAFALGVAYTRSSLFPTPFRVSVSDYDLRAQLSFGAALFLSTSWAVRLEFAGELGLALSHASRQRGDRLSSLLSSFVPEPPGRLAWLALGLECRR